MRTDYDHWEPISVSDAVRIFAEILLVGISPEAGLDLYLGSRPGNTAISIS